MTAGVRQQKKEMKARTPYLATAGCILGVSWVLILALALFSDHTPDAKHIPLAELIIIQVLKTISLPVTAFIHRQPNTPTELAAMAVCTAVIAPLIWAIPVFIAAWLGNRIDKSRSAEQPEE